MKRAVSFATTAAKNAVLKNVSVKSPMLLTKPISVSIVPTLRCNVECIMCDCWKEKNDYITDQHILDFLDDMADWVGPNFFVQIAGGEPLVFKGIYDIFKRCADRKIICKISSNGYGLNPQVCNKIIDSGLQYLTVSLDSHLPEVHDRYRGIPGTFEKAVEGLRYLREHGNLTLGISSIIMKENIGYVKEMAEYFLSIDIDRILFQPIRDYYNPIEKWMEYEHWIHDLDALNRGMDQLIELKSKHPRLLNTVEDFELMRGYFADPNYIRNARDCHIGYEQLYVDDKGDITMCNEYDIIGNIKDRNIKEVWHAQKTRELRDQMVKCNLPCTSNCKKELSMKDKIRKFQVLYKSGLFN